MEPSELLKVYVARDGDCCEERTPIAGRYSIKADAVEFRPAFGFDPGQDYVVATHIASSAQFVPFRIAPEAAREPAMVTDVYPSGDVLPENVLRFYIHFTVPMKPHVAFDHIKLRDAEGRIDDAAFMRFKQELWNEDRTRLTVLLDPGRIKRNVATNVDLGPALLAGRSYTLLVEAGWPSADGATMLPGYSKRFTVSDPLRTRPDIDQMQITAPCVGTNEPLQIAFERPYDRHLLDKSIYVTSKGGSLIEGSVQISGAESKWAFTPAAPWFLDTVQVHVDPELEDVAANNFRDLLDHPEDSEIKDVSAMSISVGLRTCKG